MVDRPVFVVGAERSGTTMLRLMLDDHPDIAFNGEFEFLVDFISPDGALPSHNEFKAHVENDRVFRHWNLPMPRDLDFAGLANHFLEHKLTGAKVAGATVHRNFDRLLYIWPEARFIHIVRDGRDVALSHISMGWAGNMYTAIADWIAVEELWSSVSGKIPSDRHITLYYEGLIEHPEAELQRLCVFLGVPYDAAMLEYDKHTTYSKPTRGNSEKWRSAPAPDIAAAEFRAASQLREAGYQLSQPRRPSRLQLFAYNAHDALYRAQFRRRRYGTALWLKDVVARRVKHKGWRDSVRQRINAIDEQHLK